jgi:hypothetical protein
MVFNTFLQIKLLSLIEMASFRNEYISIYESSIYEGNGYLVVFCYNAYTIYQIWNLWSVERLREFRTEENPTMKGFVYEIRKGESEEMALRRVFTKYPSIWLIPYPRYDMKVILRIIAMPDFSGA